MYQRVTLSGSLEQERITSAKQMAITALVAKTLRGSIPDPLLSYSSLPVDGCEKESILRSGLTKSVRRSCGKMFVWSMGSCSKIGLISVRWRGVRGSRFFRWWMWGAWVGVIVIGVGGGRKVGAGIFDFRLTIYDLRN